MGGAIPAGRREMPGFQHANRALPTTSSESEGTANIEGEVTGITRSMKRERKCIGV